MSAYSEKRHHGGLIGLAGLLLAIAGCGWLATTEPGQQRLWMPLQVSHLPGDDKALPAQAATGGEASFIVRIKGEEAVDALIKTWRRDRDAAKAAYETWAQGRGIFGELELTGCSYSGELILTRRFAEDEVMTRSRVSDMLENLRAKETVAYADPDFTAFPGNREN